MKELLLKRKPKFFLYISACLLSVFTNLLINLVIALLIGSIEVGTLKHLINISIIAIIVVVFSSFLYIISRFMRMSFMRDTLLDIRLSAFDKILNSSYKDFSRKSKDSYISNLINDINILENTYFDSLLNIIFSCVSYGASMIIIMILNVKFGLLVFTCSLILIAISKSFEKRTVKLQEEVSSYNEYFAIDMSNTFNGLEILKLNNVEGLFLEKASKSAEKLEGKKFNFNFYSNSQKHFLSFLGSTFLILTIIYLSNLINKGISLTRLALLIQVSGLGVWNLASILPLFNQLKSSSKIYDKITAYTKNDPTRNSSNILFNLKNEIIVNNLSFNYNEKNIFRNSSFKIQKGKKYLIKGPSGSGKSTLIKLLSMTYDDYEGCIEIDGINYKEIKESSLSDKVSFIYQDVFLFEDTIYNNIALYKDYNEEEVINAAKQAGLSSLISKKEGGIHEMLMENGKNLSGGEKQRISIARAIIKNSQILFTDEATSSLDENLGREIEKTILALDSTVIAISHRYYKGISEKYDYILEINNGEISQYNSIKYFAEVAI